MASAERDWSSLRNREWRPTVPPEDSATGGGSSSSSGAPARGQGRGGSQAGRGRGSGTPVAASSSEPAAVPKADATSRASPQEESASPPGKEKEKYRPPRGDDSRFKTDVEITSRGKGGKQPREERKLIRWQADDSDPSSGALEDMSLSSMPKQRFNAKKGSEPWDQFKVNEELFGVKSSFKNDLSQYTTVLDVKNMPAEVRQRATQLAKEIEGKSSVRDMDTGAEYEEEWEGDEEDLFSAVPRTNGYNSHWKDDSHEEAAGDGGIGGALLASLRAGGGAAPEAEGSARPGGDYRSLITPKVHDWWKARSQSGAKVPPGCQDALVCPFSERVFGDVTQLLTHWAAALPRPAGSKERSPCDVATEQFRRAGAELSFSQMLQDYGLETLLNVTSPRAGSVWEQIIAKLDIRGKSGGAPPLMERRVVEFADEAVQMRCWRRDQKVEHREVLEGIAAGLALYILQDTSCSAWTPSGS